MNHVLTLIGPLWRLCTDSSYKSLPGGAAGLQNRRTGFDPLAACHSGRMPNGQAPDCNPGTREFDSHLALQVVVTPTMRPRIGARYPSRVSSVGERLFYTQIVGGSNPSPGTKRNQRMGFTQRNAKLAVTRLLQIRSGAESIASKFPM